jgi:translation initiation factor IF-2
MKVGLYIPTNLFSNIVNTCLRLGPLVTLKHGKKDMTEIRKGMECGLSFAKFDKLQEGDLIQMYEEIEKPGAL